MFEEMTFETVMDRMLDRIDDAYDKRESSPVYMALAPAALEIANIYAALDDMMDETFADTASMEYLERLALARGIVPRPATNAIVQAEFTPKSTEVEIGTKFAWEDLAYIVLEKTADGIYRLECTEAGEAGNGYTGEIIPNEYIDGLETAGITKILVYGEDEEDTESFRRRYMESFEANSFGGNKADYQNKVLEISGVGAAKVVPVWEGAGTVKLVILDTGFRKASEGLIDKVQKLFDPQKDGCGSGLAPIGHIVTVDTAAEIPIQITGTITYDTGYDWNSCKVPVEEAIGAYFLKLQREWSGQEASVIRQNSIHSAILSVPGVLDVNGTALNGTEGNLLLGPYEIPVFGGVVYG